jgi:hypothetical protein
MPGSLNLSIQVFKEEKKNYQKLQDKMQIILSDYLKEARYDS